MKNLFLTPERIVLRSYQRETSFRFAGCIFLLTGLLQLPIVLLAGAAWRDYQVENDRRVGLLATANELQEKLGTLKETRQKLTQIQQWEPIIQNRLPCSAVLAAIERAVPKDAVLDRIAIESGRFQALPVNGGTYRVPQQYSVSIQGSLRLGCADEMETFAVELRKRFPAGSQLLRSKLLDPTENVIPFLIAFSITPDGNYSALGVQRIADPERL